MLDAGKISFVLNCENSKMLVLIDLFCFFYFFFLFRLKRASPGIEPGPPAPKAGILPLNYKALILIRTSFFLSHLGPLLFLANLLVTKTVFLSFF